LIKKKSGFGLNFDNPCFVFKYNGFAGHKEIFSLIESILDYIYQQNSKESRERQVPNKLI